MEFLMLFLLSIYVRSWNELSEQMKASLIRAGMVNKKGKIIK